MEEIKEILKKHDIGAFVVLHTPGNAEHLLEISPTYSCAFWDHTPGKEGIRVRAKLTDFGGDSAKRHQVVTDTVNMFDLLTRVTANHTVNLMKVMDMLKSNMDITSTGGSSSSSTTQNN